jgi:hypothetical protein
VVGVTGARAEHQVPAGGGVRDEPVQGGVVDDIQAGRDERGMPFGGVGRVGGDEPGVVQDADLQPGVEGAAVERVEQPLVGEVVGSPAAGPAIASACQERDDGGRRPVKPGRSRAPAPA